MRIGTILGGIGITGLTLFGINTNHKEEKERISHLKNGDDIALTLRLENKLDSLRNSNKVSTIKIIEKKHILEKVVETQEAEIKDLIIENKEISKEVKDLKKNLNSIKPDTIVIRDTIRIKESKNFWGRVKKDTLK